VFIISMIGIMGVIGVSILFLSNQPNSTLVTLHELNIPLREQNLFEGFLEWSAKYNKIYSDPSEQAYRYRIFKENAQIIKELIDSGISHQVELNNFADLSSNEYKSRYLSEMPKSTRPKNIVRHNTDKLPSAVDWRLNGTMTPVPNQGQCGSSWAFGAVHAVEALKKLSNLTLSVLSVQQILDCSRDYGNYGCNGGFMDFAYQYIIE